MAAFKAIVVTLLSILSIASATDLPADETTSQTSRSLLGKCNTKAFAQCGGKGQGGPKDGPWRCCPAGFTCKKSNPFWWSCQKKSGGGGGGKCKTRAFAQCGGRGLGGPKDGPWRCCPSGFTCKKYNQYWWSCQKGGGRKPTPKPRGRNPTPRVGKNANKRVRDGGAYDPKEWNPCGEIMPSMASNSHWCKFPKVKRNPSRYGLKVDQQTMYNGPILNQIGYCGDPLQGGFDGGQIAGIAVSTKYLARGGWKFGYCNGQYCDPFCGKCACIRLTGNNYWVNPTPNPPEWKNYIGTVIKARVVDMCPECPDDAIDILMDRGYTTSPEVWNNPRAGEVNSKPGRRPVPLDVATSVGVWTIEWDWLDDCSQNCDANFFKP